MMNMVSTSLRFEERQSAISMSVAAYIKILMSRGFYSGELLVCHLLFYRFQMAATGLSTSALWPSRAGHIDLAVSIWMKKGQSGAEECERRERGKGEVGGRIRGEGERQP